MPSTPASSQRPVFSTRSILLMTAVGAIAVLLLAVFLPRIGPGVIPGAPDSSTIKSVMFNPALGPQEGVIPSAKTIDINSDLPAVTQLDPELRRAFEGATSAAAKDGQALLITSGWRSVRYQEELFGDAVETYGNETLAREFVAPADKSSHTAGRAVDVGPLDAQLWLMEHGNDYGLCQMYVNERWHFEVATKPGEACPEMLADASQM